MLQQEILLKGGGENSRQQLDREIIAITVPLEFTILWPLLWWISLSIRVQTTLNYCWFVKPKLKQNQSTLD